MGSSDPIAHIVGNRCVSHFYDDFPLLPSSLTLAHLNVQSIISINKFTQLRDYIISSSCDVFSVSETWLTDSNASLYHISDYNFLSKQSNFKSRGSGIGCYVRKCWSSSIVNVNVSLTDSESKAIEFLAVELINSSTRYLVLTLYRTHTSLTAFLSALDKILYSISMSKTKIFILGDFNFDFGCVFHDSALLNCLHSFDFKKTISTPTRVCHYHDSSGRVTHTSSTVIDNIFVPSSEIYTSGVIKTDISDHYLIFCIIHPTAFLQSPSPSQKWKSFRVLSESNTSRFVEMVGSISWEEIVSCVDSSMAFSAFHSRFESLYNNCFPILRGLIRPSTCSGRKPWFNHEVQGLALLKQRLYRRFKSSGDNSDRLKYHHAKRKFERMCATARCAYYENKFTSLHGDSKLIWKEINACLDVKPKNNVNLIHRLQSSNHSYTGNSIATVLNSHFASIGERLNEDLPPSDITEIDKYLHPINTRFEFALVSPQEVIKMAKSMKHNLGNSLKSCPSSLIVKSIDFLAIPLSHIFNISVITGIFPDSLKNSIITPIFKKGSKEDPGNYRPISVTHFFAKLFEKLMKNQIMHFMSSNNLISKNQYGFQRNKSCEMALLDISSTITKAIDSNKFALGVFMDIQKAFDCVPHDRLLRKLKFYGFSETSIGLVSTFLTGRTQQTKANDVLSSILPVSCGIPQGTVLGPILFIIYINDFLDLLHAKITSFADDTTLLYVDSCVDALVNRVNSDLSLAAKWFSANRLTFNISKTQYILFKALNSRCVIPSNSISVNNILLSETFSICCLGVHFSANLSWQTHVSFIVSRLSYVLSVLYKLNRSKVPVSVLLSVYKGLFLPYVDYCSLVWSPMIGMCLLKKLQIMQNKAVRLIFSLPPLYSDIANLLHSFHQLTISERFYLQTSAFAYNTIHGLNENFLNLDLYNVSDVHSYMTRTASNSRLFVCPSRTNFAKNFLANKLISS